jgi:hypothetical protein
MKGKVFCVIAVGIVATGGFVLMPRGGKTKSAKGAEKPDAIAFAGNDDVGLRGESVELHNAVEQGLIKAQFLGNGRETMRTILTNSGGAPLKIQANAGQVLEAGRNVVVVVRSRMIAVAPGQTVEIPLPTCAVASTNRIGEATYKLSSRKSPKLQPLLDYVTDHLELSPNAIQTAALALTENLPLSAVSKFSPAAGELKSRFNTDAFRAETIDIIAALSALKAIGIPESAIAMTIDPQLKIEAMIEPLCHAAAMQYYGLTAETEWEYWKSELLAGAPATRHYALYGIARFYPEIALDMLPKWAREPKTNAVYRISALQALADTQRLEALPILRQLADELGLDTEVGRAARGAAEYLNQRLNQLAVRQPSVAFRASQELSRF